MKLILKEDVEKLGEAGDVVDVADGYARNYLLPRQLAVEATEHRLNQLEKKQEKKKKKEKNKRENAEEIASDLEDEKYSFSVKAGEEGRLFGSVTSKDIAEKLKDKGYEVEKKDVELDENIKSLGVHKVSVKIYDDIYAEIKVKVEEA